MSHYDVLKGKWIQKHKDVQSDVWDKHKEFLQPHVDKLLMAPRQLIAGSMAGLMILAQPAPASLIAQTAQTVQDLQQDIPDIPAKQQLMADLKGMLPPDVQPLSEEENIKISEVLSQHFNIAVSHNLGGKPLNRTYGIIGAEQHLMRYPGDTMASHFSNSQDAEKYYSSGMAPGRGGWGYFAQSVSSMTEEDVMREKYYIAVQTFLAPGWSQDIRGHYEFYKFRKMLVVNPENGKALVAVIGDAGPAQWTGKHLGGSPEVMIYLQRVDGSRRGPVLYYFIDDPENKVPLGPIEVQS